MSNSAVFTPFFKNFLDENQALKEKVMKQVQKKYEQVNQQQQADQIMCSTPIMKLFNLKTKNLNDSNIRFFDSYQNISPIQIPSNKEKDILPILNTTRSISNISNKDYSPLQIHKSSSNHIHNKFKLIRCNVEQQKQQNNDENQFNQNIEENPQNAYYTNGVLQNGSLTSRQVLDKSKRYSVSTNNLESPLYKRQNKQSLIKSINQLSPLKILKKSVSSSISLKQLTVQKSTSRIASQKNIPSSSKINSQTLIDTDNSQKQNRSIVIHPTNQPIKFEYRIRQHVSTDRQFDRKSNESTVQLSQNSIICPEKIKMIENNNLAIAELIQGSKQIKKNYKYD